MDRRRDNNTSSCSIIKWNAHPKQRERERKESGPMKVVWSKLRLV